MKIFLDTANIDEIREGMKLGLVDGVTTNPTLVSRESVKFEQRVVEICETVRGPVSAEVTATDFENMVSQARELASLSEYVVVKIPMTKDGMRAVKTLSGEGIRTNVTLIFNSLQATLAAKAGATYVSPFVGRLDDIASKGMGIVEEIVDIFANYGYCTEIIVASVRHPMHVLEAALMGADIVTIPFDVLLRLFNHPLTDIGIERFTEDWKRYEKQQGQ
ncbi:transaldolase [Mesotoga sp. Brook.08.YT.4.2.5.1]|uniref:Probable transaldolase n=1 Tax=Mesotoga prima TaxID=1184387 RepID=A0A101HLQ7_9BACT|nr:MULTISPECIES: fructose-6-phosphate aldolase [unclassified Mesotoga]KUK79128.1 MAG: putative transaldolase [Mesotoga prima]PNE23036.1 transaldolase [Mesotoga sp. Brook.08.YT.4.2.5.1]PVD15894.1 transaldolase [Mesotoga sp. Brook.08.105.5.1]RAO97699.1 transaldolase [Mesotoga sp. Brook.08.YT.4.2.5.4.]RDI93918.1 transaldolase [Mesotoga sp. Brook.08.YT.4.2.5.2.]